MPEEIDINDEEDKALERAWDKLSSKQSTSQSWTSGDVYFDSPETPLPDWREESSSSDEDDDEPLSEDENEGVIGMLGFDPEDEDDDEDYDEDEEEEEDEEEDEEDDGYDEDEENAALSIDKHGLHHRDAGPGGGQFMKKGETHWQQHGSKTVKHGSMKSQYYHHKPKKIDGEHIKLPNYRQRDEHSCSFVAALSVVHYFSPGVSPKKVMAAVRPTKSGGANRRRLVRALDKFNITATYRKDLTLKRLYGYVKRGIPVIITVWPEDWSSDHWTTVQGFSADKKRIFLSNHKSLSRAQFRKDWYDQGEGLVCREKDKDKEE